MVAVLIPQHACFTQTLFAAQSKVCGGYPPQHIDSAAETCRYSGYIDWRMIVTRPVRPINAQQSSKGSFLGAQNGLIARTSEAGRSCRHEKLTTGGKWWTDRHDDGGRIGASGLLRLRLTKVQIAVGGCDTKSAAQNRNPAVAIIKPLPPPKPIKTNCACSRRRARARAMTADKRNYCGIVRVTYVYSLVR